MRVFSKYWFAILVNICTRQQQCSCDECALNKCRGGSGVGKKEIAYKMCDRPICALRRAGEERFDGVHGKNNFWVVRSRYVRDFYFKLFTCLILRMFDVIFFF